MFSIKKRYFVYSIIIYIALFLVGAFILLLFQRYSQHGLREEAAQYASEYVASGYQPVDIRNMNLTTLLLKSGELTFLAGPSHHLNINSTIENIVLRNQNKDSFYVVIFDMKTGQFLSLAGQSISDDKDKPSMIILGHYLTYLNSVYMAYFFIYTPAYLLVCLSLFLIARYNDRVRLIHQQYLANVSHELKSPISSISAIADTLSEIDSLDEKTRSKYYGIILRESKRLDHTVKDIIELSKLQDPYQEINKVTAFGDDIFNPILSRYQEWCENLDIHFVLNPSIHQLPALYTDISMIHKLLTILMDNSMKFMQPGDTLSIDSTPHSDYVDIHICDTGCGIAAEHLPHIFERFYKVDDSSNLSGSGLGLSMAQEIVHRLGESIKVKSEPGKGTCFTFTIHKNATKKRHYCDKNSI
ncbi:sensor histidine kinase [Eubacterium oxidoreducens]|uniref:histidine kinase n=1 Tax=Eubacterium oxidoreducens TaxID=1732 RepID=A0A1G6BT65_EUBOX|nr:HAMP domain-containing sensor histidine kinase [Eubacterium oxidoreducens]SDB23813.1 His Kinase A (phospho-acceptor) domain-containing protein [Eubacterium oxidoreducens]